VTSGNPSGFLVNINLGGGAILNVNVTAAQIIADGAPFYTRWVGGLEGSMNGGEVLKGVALFEEFKLTE
jgi:hypothetical protein